MNSLQLLLHNASLSIKRWQSLLLILPLAIAACSGPPPASPPIEFETLFLNNHIRLTTNDLAWPLKTDGEITLLLESNTANEIVFPSNYNLRIFYHDDLSWHEILEMPVVRNQEQFVMTPKDPMSLFRLVSFRPLYIDPDKRYLMRVYVSGEMATAEGRVLVAAFVGFFCNAVKVSSN